MNIIADIAGRYDELMLLLDKMPKGEEIVLLGDLNDRGPDTNKVIQWAIDNNIRCVKSNHGNMMLKACKQYFTGNFLHEDVELFLINGGNETFLSYGGFQNIPQEHLTYLVNCEWYIETDDLILSHAPINPNYGYKNNNTEEFLWNRQPPKRLDKFQIHGHNTYYTEFNDKGGLYAICLDNSGNNKLTGIHWPSRKIYTQEYLK